MPTVFTFSGKSPFTECHLLVDLPAPIAEQQTAAAQANPISFVFISVISFC